jgi:hypothetical protein
MGKTSKTEQKRGLSQINLGEERKSRIRKFRAKMEMKGTTISSIDDAVNTLLDKALELERV